MFCANCGRLLEDDEKYCPICGALNEEAPKSSNVGSASTSTAFVQGDDPLKASMASEAMKWGIISLAFALSGCLSFLGFIFSFTAKKRVNEYVNTFGGMEGRVRVGHILGRVGFGFGLGYTIFLAFYVVIYAAMLVSMM